MFWINILLINFLIKCLFVNKKNYFCKKNKKMRTNFILSLLVSIVLFSCKNEAKKESEEVKVQEVSNVFKVILDVKVNKDDTFHLFYTEDSSINFTEESSLWVELKASPDSQQVEFILPENIIPTQLRVDFGINKDQEDIVINSFKMEYNGKNYQVGGNQFFTLFRPNELVTQVDLSTNTIKPVKKEGGQYFGPSFYPLEPLAEQIKLLVR